ARAGAVVGAGGGELRTVGRESDGDDEALVPVGAGEGLELLASGQFPDLDGRVTAGGDEVLAVGGEGPAAGRRLVALGGGDEPGRVLAGGGQEWDDEAGEGEEGEGREWAEGSDTHGRASWQVEGGSAGSPSAGRRAGGGAKR